MRRGFSIFLILLFGLGPLSAAIDGSEDTSLPLCCRRHGVHQCTLGLRMAATGEQADSRSTPVVTVPATCPQFPGAAAMFATAAPALTAAAVSAPIGPERAHGLAAGRVSVPSALSHAHAGRGPPEANLS